MYDSADKTVYSSSYKAGLVICDVEDRVILSSFKRGK